MFKYSIVICGFLFFFSSRRRHTRLTCDWSSDVCSSDLSAIVAMVAVIVAMALVDDVRSQLIPSFISLAVVLVAGWLRYRQARRRARRRRAPPRPAETPGAPPPGPQGRRGAAVGGVAPLGW